MILPVDNFYNKRLFLWALRSLDQEIGKLPGGGGGVKHTHTHRGFVFCLKTMGFYWCLKPVAEMALFSCCLQFVGGGLVG